MAKRGTIKLSFEDDEAADEIGDFKLKKSKASKRLKKKINQPPDILTVEESQSQLSFTYLGGTYNADNLAKLRQDQCFTVSHAKDEERQSFQELTGDDAEAFDNMASTVHEATADVTVQNWSKSHEETLKFAKLAREFGDGDERINMIPPAQALPDYVPLFSGDYLDTDISWEKDLLKRGSITANRDDTLPPKATGESVMKSRNNDLIYRSSASHDASTDGHETTLLEILGMLRSSAASLEEKERRYTLRKSTLEAELLESSKESQRLKTQVQVDAKCVHTLQVIGVNRRRLLYTILIRPRSHSMKYPLFGYFVWLLL